MKIPIYQIDAFTSEVFSGNPAAVCLLDTWLDDKCLQSIAAENNLSETAFLVQNNNDFDIRWFTPVAEVSLCGHATLASAFVLFSCRNYLSETIRFKTRKSGELIVTKQDKFIEMDFPARQNLPCPIPVILTEALHIKPKMVFSSEEDLLVVLDNENIVREIKPNFGILEKLEYRGIIITATGSHCDFVSRFFAPRFGIPEDPVTGSAHCVLIPYWASVLGKNKLHALQVSKRGGELFCANAGERVKISGKAVRYLEGMITV